MKNFLLAVTTALVTLLSTSAARAQEEVTIQPTGAPRAATGFVGKAFVMKNSSSKFKSKAIAEATAKSFGDYLEEKFKRRGLEALTATIDAKLLIATNADQMDWFEKQVGSSKKKVAEAREREAGLNLPKVPLHIITELQVSLTERQRGGTTTIFGVKPSARQKFYVLAVIGKSRAIGLDGKSVGETVIWKEDTDVMLRGDYKLSVVGTVLKYIPVSKRVGEYDESSKPDLCERLESLLDKGSATVASRIGI